MPRKNNKNRRRVVAAERALAAVTPKTTRAKRPRRRVSVRPTRGVPRPVVRSSALMLQAKKYIHSLGADVLLTDVTLPTFSRSQPYARLHLQRRFQPVADGLGGFAVVVNPNLVWATRYLYETVLAGALIKNTIPTVYTNTGGTQAFPSSVGGGAVGLQGQIGTDDSTKMMGFARCHGVQYRVDYIGQNSGKGGAIYCFHNGQNVPANYQKNGPTTGFAWDSTFASLSAMSLATQHFSEHYMGTSFRHVWRPVHTEFEPVSTYRTNQEYLTTTATENAFNSNAVNELPLPQTNHPAPSGWTSGIYVVPAVTATLSSTVPYLVTVDAYVDVFYTSANSSQTSFPVTECAVADPSASVAINNALGHLHHTRSTNVASLSANNTGLAAFEKMVTNGVSDVASIGKDMAVEAMTRAMASSFAS